MLALAAPLSAVTGKPTIIANAGVGSTAPGGSWATNGVSDMAVATAALDKVGKDIDGIFLGVTVATLLSDGAKLTIQHSTGTNFVAQPAAGYGGFRVYDNLGALVADSENAQTVVTKVSATKVKVPFVVDRTRPSSRIRMARGPSRRAVS